MRIFDAVAARRLHLQQMPLGQIGSATQTARLPVLRNKKRLLLIPLLLGGVLLAVAQLAKTLHVPAAEEAQAAGPVVLVRVDLVPPIGWRRTANGWQRIEEDSEWTINHWMAIHRQRQSENGLLRTLSLVGRIHPISLAAGQLCVVCLIAALAREHQEKSRARATPAHD